VPSSIDGAACGDGSTACAGGIKKKGNSGSGEAAAEPEKAIAPIANAPKAAARQELNFDAAKFNIIVPCSIARAPFRHVIGRIDTGERFRDICLKAAKTISSLNALLHEFFSSSAARNVVCGRLHGEWQF
jgi:hypothetical protein